MTIQTYLSDFLTTRDYPVVPTQVGIIQEGAALTQVLSGSTFMAQLSQGASNNDVFIGLALNERRNPVTPVQVDVLTVALVNSAYIVVTSFTPLATCGVRNASNVALTLGSLTGSGTTFTQSGSTLAFDASNLGVVMTVTYTYSPTIAQINQLGGWNAPGSYNSINEYLQSTGVVEQGTVYTDQIVVTDNWSAWTPATPIKAIANGLLTMASGATGATVPGRVVAVPTTDQPYLGVRFDALS